MRILGNNLLKDASSIVATNQHANYTTEALYSNLLEEVLYFTASTSTITVTFATDQVIDMICLGYHNISTATLVFKDSLAGVLDTVVLTTPTVNMKEYLLAELVDVRTVEISVTGSDTLFIGNISLGKYVQCYNVMKPMNISFYDTSENDVTDGGHVINYEGVLLKTFTIALGKVTEEQAEEFIELFASVKTGNTFWLDRHEDLEEEPLFGCFSTPLEYSEIYDFSTMSIEFREAN